MFQPPAHANANATHVIEEKGASGNDIMNYLGCHLNGEGQEDSLEVREEWQHGCQVSLRPFNANTKPLWNVMPSRKKLNRDSEAYMISENDDDHNDRI